MFGIFLQRVFFAGVILLATIPIARADKAGFYLGAGVSVATYRISTNLESSFESSRTQGWRTEAGYIWDVGRSGGFHLGVAGTFDQWGEIEESGANAFGGEWTARVQARVVAITVVLEQEIAQWVDFVFKTGPSYGYISLEETYSYDPSFPSQTHRDSGEGVGGEYIAGFAFFPANHFAVELAAQGNWFVHNEGYFEATAVGALSLSLQYRF